MRCKLLDGKEPAEKLELELKEELNNFEKKPVLLSLSIGKDAAKDSYIKSKMRLASKLGIGFEFVEFSENSSIDEILKFVKKRINDGSINGVIFERPYPDQFGLILENIPEEYDIDGCSSKNLGHIVKGNPFMVSATVQAALYFLDYYGIDTDGRSAVVVGRSYSVGLPLTLMLLSRSKNATVTTCHTKTRNLQDFTRQAELLFVAAGKPCLIKSDMVSPGAVIIDIGINILEVDGKKVTVGDVDFESVKNVAGAITPVPGGVGKLTPIFLMKNLVKAAKIIMERER